MGWLAAAATALAIAAPRTTPLCQDSCRLNPRRRRGPLASGGGRLCIVGAPIARFSIQVMNSGAFGWFSTQVAVGAIPLSPAVATQPGETWDFQAWFRDTNPGSTSNLTDAIAITFH